MLNFCCVKTGTKYGPEYVNILYDMVRRNLFDGTPGRFVCFTDNPSELSAGIETVALPKGLDGWWAKLWLFSRDAFPLGGRVIYFDLDVVITGALEPLLEYKGDIAILRDVGIPSQLNSSIMLWKAGALTEIWDKWVSAGRPEVEGGDQVWIQKCLRERIGKSTEILQQLYPEKFFSFKVECLNHDVPPKGAMVVYFHGEPKPHNCDTEWVQHIWKHGGGTADDLLMICNTAEKILADNIKSACRRDLPWLAQLPPHEKHAVIVGGGPSLKDNVDEIRRWQERGAEVFATNNTAKFLFENGVTTDFQVIVDAREENVKFLHSHVPVKVTFLASQCHPTLFDSAYNPVLWHCHTPELEAAIENPEKKPECLVACGSTVTLNAMGIAYALGYRTLHLYGVDSCYKDKEHHAYEQRVDSRERVLDATCYGRSFKAAPWMIHQANQFQELSSKLLDDGCIITVHGDGLIPWIALNMQQAFIPDTEIQEIDGVFWPSRDEAMKANVWNSLEHIPALLSLCVEKNVAVQAGGNIGLWPKQFAKHFKRVITFEPDALNFECLTRNCTAENVEKHNAALGDVPGRKALVREAKNCGAHWITDGDEFSVETIDSLELPTCDLIQLDIEGYELLALKGAEQTIRKFHPVICLEINGITAKFHGLSDADTLAWLEDLGYQQMIRFGRDVVFVNSNWISPFRDTLQTGEEPCHFNRIL